MADVFISYSREDGAFVRRLQEGLASRDKSTWVDWEGIPPTAEWLQSVYAAIEQAEAFLFVISPDSIESEVCGQELHHAAQRGKKFIPVMRREVPPAELPPDLATRQWILLRDEDDFDRGLLALVTALDTDFEWVQAHTRLLVRAVEWERTRRDRSFLLRGSNLVDAERWLGKRAGGGQAPSALHGEYIVESRRAASWRLRVLLAGVSTALGVAIALTVLLFAQYRETEARRRGEEEQRINAVQQRDAATRAREAEERERVRAEDKARLASVRQLAAESRALAPVPGNQESALVSALSALALARDVNEESIAAGALQFAIDGARGPRLIRDAVPQRLSFDPNTRSSSRPSRVVPVSYAVMSSSSSRAATLHEDGTASLWDARTGRRISDLKLDRQKLATLHFLPDGSIVAGGDDRGLVRAWEARTGRVLCTSPVGAPATGSACDTARSAIANNVARSRIYEDASFRSPDGTITVMATPRDGVQLAHAGGLTIDIQPGSTTRIDVVRISPDNKYVFTAGEGRPSLWDAATGNLQTVLEGAGIINAAEFSGDSRLIVTAGFDGTARVWSIESGEELLRLVGHVGRVHSATFSEDDQSVITASMDGGGRIWNARAGDVISARRLRQDWIHTGSVSSSGDRLAAAGYFGPIQVWDLDRNTFDVEMAGIIGGVSFSRDEQELLIVGRESITVRNLRDGRVQRWSGVLRSISEAAYIPGSGHIVAIGPSDGIAMWDPATSKTTWRVSSNSAEGHLIVASPLSRDVVSAHSGGFVRAWHIGEQAPFKSWRAHARTINTLALSPDGARLLTAGDDGVARIWEPSSGKLLFTLGRHEGAVTSAAFSPDGNLVLTTGSDAIARICSALSGECERVLPGHSGVLMGGAFSPDGKRVLTWADDNTARLWDVQSAQLVATFGGHSKDMTGAFFVRNGRAVLTIGQDGLALVHEATTAGLRNLACGWLRYQPEWQAVREACASSIAAAASRRQQ